MRAMPPYAPASPAPAPATAAVADTLAHCLKHVRNNFHSRTAAVLPLFLQLLRPPKPCPPALHTSSGVQQVFVADASAVTA